MDFSRLHYDLLLVDSLLSIKGRPGSPDVSRRVELRAGHDQSYDNSSAAIIRGNLTGVSRFDVNDSNGAATTSSMTTSTSTTMTYDAAGSPLSTSDPLGHTGSISYADSFSDGINHNTFAYPTSVTDADNFSSYLQYNYDFGAKTRAQNPLGAVQMMTYDEATRLKQATTTNTGAYVHYDYGPDYTSSFASVNSVAANYWESDSYTNRFFDGLGRVFAVASNHPGSTGGNKGQYTRYDQMGRAVQQTNPFEMDSGWNPSGDDAAGYQFNVANTFDWKGRPLKTYNMDGTYKEASYAGCGCAGGEVVTLTDEVERQQKVSSDVLGRQWKTEVLDSNANVYSATTSSYNARDQISAVNSYKGTATSDLSCPTGTCMQSLTTYDGHGRVVSHKLPQQTAATSYEYNPDDTVRKITDPRGVAATNTYNARRLLTGVSYDTGSSGVPALAAISFEYDGGGNKTLITDGTGSTAFGYDQLSRMTSESHYINDLGTSYALSYGYNLVGELASINDPTNAQVSYNYDSSGRLLSMPASGYTGVTNFLSNTQYRAFGALKHATYGNSAAQLNLTYNTRMQIGQYQLIGSNFTAGATMNYYDDGRTNTAFDLSDSRFDRKYEFDFSARLKEAYSGVEAHGASAPPLNQANSPYRQSYSYDQYNNVTSRSGRVWTSNDGDTATYTDDNKRAGYIYDWAGNVGYTADGGYNYDAAGRPSGFASQQNWQVYPNWASNHPNGPALETTDSFDGAGEVVKHTEHARTDLSTQYEDGYIAYYMTESTTSTFYVHSAVLGGKTIAELDQNGVKTKGYVYSGGARIATQHVSGSTNSTSFESTNPVTGAVTTTDANGTSASRQEPDPLGRDLTTLPDPNIVLDPIGVSSKMNSPMYIEYQGNWTGEMESGMAQYVDTMEMVEAHYAYERWLKASNANPDLKNATNADYNIWQNILNKNPNVGIVAGKKTLWGSEAADYLERNASSISIGENGTLLQAGRKYRAAVASDITIADTSESFDRVKDDLIAAILDIANNQKCSDAFKKFGLRIPYDSLLGSDFRIAPAATLFRANGATTLGLTSDQVTAAQSHFSSNIPYTEGGAAAETLMNGRNLTMVFKPSQLSNPVFGGLKAIVIHEFIHGGYKPGGSPYGKPYGDLNYFKEGYEYIQNACK